ncbi:Hemolysin-type calcium-binding repeat (2 copies) [Seminavis robusta]|uniref:Hemolysin-type calcium-binding repeat (2 copies) n=1 Tax=Seminavis robusta TaxID=568900 RepID=A0A9N8D746_9STRA|nr:Hemolysin-type calcium-binding repeat (2 copies) [Seminavis robusta]|eukprot:Sro4_g003610.1 Hemolysin-type calcium-binding repeat (2 copies) (1738) ;mRNA; r:200371-205677
MKFTMWISLALVGIGVFFARDGNAQEAAIDESIARRRISQSHQVNSSTPPQRIPQQTEDDDDDDDNLALQRALAQEQKQQSIYRGTTNRKFKAREADEAWFGEFLLRTSMMGSMLSEEPSQAPTRDPTGSPTLEPTIRAQTEKPSPMPVTETPTLSPTNSPMVKPTKSPTTESPTTESPTVSPTKTPTTKSPTTSPTDSPTTSPTDNPTTTKPTVSPTKTPSEAPTIEPTEAPSPNPSADPTPAPTFEPTEAPTTKIPSGIPTRTPSTSPTIIPTQSPTSSPTFNPTVFPTPGPTVSTVAPTTVQPTLQPTTTAPTTLQPTTDPPTTNAPSPAPISSFPTMLPTGNQSVGPPTQPCTVEVEISCIWAVDGETDCRDIPIPGACSAKAIPLQNVGTGVPLSSVAMLYDYMPCNSSLTLQQQPEEFECFDQGQPSSSTSFDAQIACIDDEMNVLVDSTFSPGQFVLLEGMNANGDLGQVVRCEISEVTIGQDNEQILNRVQEMHITTAVVGNFYLQDRYGSFVVESCEDQRCVEPVQYSYTVTNTQSEAQTIAELMRNRSGDMVSLLPLIPADEFTLEPGQSTVVTEEGGVNLCFDATIDTNVMVRTTEEDGSAFCRGSDDYSILVEVECRIDIDITCMTDEGDECSGMGLPVVTCAIDGEEVRALRMRYEGSPCNATMNSQGDVATCRDFTMPIDRVLIVCTDSVASTPLPLETAIESGEADVGDGDTIVLSLGGVDGAFVLPFNVSCEIRGSLDNVLHQVVSFDASGGTELNLQDRFGSLQVEACSTDSLRLDCLTTVCLEYSIQNVGTNDVDIIDLTRTLRGDTGALIDLLPTTMLVSGQRTEAVEKFVVDSCAPEEYCISSVVQSSGANELVCEDEDELCFLGMMQCQISLDMSCLTSIDGVTGDCIDLQGEQFPQCVCEECVGTLRFRYTASPCPDTAVPGLLSCLDENPMPEAGASIVISAMDTVLFEGVVANGEEVELTQDTNCLPGEILMAVSAEGATTSSQVVSIDTSCSDPGIILLENFGAFQFTGYTCPEENTPHFCFVDARFDMVAANVGSDSQTVTSFNFTINGAETDLLEDIGDRQLDPSETLAVNTSVVLERCVTKEYLATSSVEGNDGECSAAAVILIGPLEPGTPSPSSAPVTPTLAPTQSPTTQAPVPIPPNAEPTEVPSQAPTSDCVLDVQTECIPPPGSDSCEEIRTEPVLCQDRPRSMVFLYEGGDCGNSFNAQSGPLSICRDFNGGPPTEFGESSYIVVTDIRGAGILYFHGWVGVGELFSIALEEGGLLDANQNITVYATNDTVPDNIIQTLKYHSSCSDSPEAQSLFLKDRFGAMQLVGFNNSEQGEVSCFVTAGIETSVTVAQTVSGQPVTMTSIVSRFTSAPEGDEGLVNFTSQVEGEELSSDGPAIDVNFDLDLNLTVRRTYSVFTTVTGLASDGRECRGSDLFQFAAGQAPPPLFPTIAPTQFPTQSLQPSPDPQTTPCELTAVLTCIVIRGGSNTCAGLQNPSDVTCTGDMSPSSLTFVYTGDRCPVNPQNYECLDTELNSGAPRENVFVEVTEGERIIGFSEVGLNEMIVVDGDYGASTRITLYTVVNGLRGDELQILDIPTSCDPNDDLTLLNQYGALQLTGFTNAASGEQGISAQIELIYAVENSGFQVTEVSSALIIDAFDGGPFEIVDDPFLLESGAVTILNRNEQTLNLRLKEQLERIDTFFLSVRGTSTFNNIACTDTAQLSF